MEFKTLNNGLKMPMVGLGVYNISERETQKRLTLDGCIVISVGLFGHSGDDDVWKPGVKEMLDDMHLRKIDMADEIFVINVGGYIGESTRREIAYAEQKGKKVNYLESCTA
jgi:hypothetical protein